MRLKNEIAIAASSAAGDAQEIIDSLLALKEKAIQSNVYAYSSILGMAISAHMTLLSIIEASEKMIDAEGFFVEPNDLGNKNN